MPSRSRSKLWRWNMTFSQHAFLPQPQRASLQLGSVDWLGSWVDVYIAVFILFRWWDMPPEAARLTGNVRGTRQMTVSLFFGAIQGDLSPDDRPWPVIYLRTALMWEKWGGCGDGGWQKTRRMWRASGGKDLTDPLCQYQQPFCIFQWTLEPAWDPWLAAFRARNQIYIAGTFAIQPISRGAKPLSLFKWMWIEIVFLQFNVCGSLWPIW